MVGYAWVLLDLNFIGRRWHALHQWMENGEGKEGSLHSWGETLHTRIYMSERKRRASMGLDELVERRFEFAMVDG